MSEYTDNHEEKKGRPQGFLTMSKFLIVFSIFGMGLWVAVQYGVFAGVRTNTTIPATNLTNGLVGHWTMDGKDMATGQVNDVSGNGKNGSIRGIMSTTTAYVSGKVGQSILLGGKELNRYINLGNVLNAPSAITISFWAEMEEATTSTFGFVAKGGSGQAGYRFMVQSGTSVRWEGSTSGGDGGFNIAVSLAPIGTWKHYVGTYDGSTARLYADGVLIGTDTTAAGAITTQTANNLIGDLFTNNSSLMPKGRIDDVYIFNRALSAKEVEQLYKLGATSKIDMTIDPPRLSDQNSSLLAHWTFDGKDTMTGQIMDTSGQGNNGSTVGMATTTAFGGGRLGQAISFDGVDDLVRFGNSPQLTSTSPFSIAFWTYINRFTTGKYNNVIGLKTNLAEGYCIFISGNTGYQGISFGSPTLWYEGRTTGDISPSFLGAWKQVTLVYDGVSASSASSYTIYVDGAPVAIVANNGVTGINNTTALGSCNTANANFWMNGKIDDVRIYNRALSLSEIQQLYKLGATSKISTTIDPPRLADSDSGLVGHWTFDGKDTLTGQVNDTSGNGNNGSMKNMATSTAYVRGAMGQGLQFDGVDDKISIESASNLPQTALTSSAWVRPTRAKSWERILVLRAFAAANSWAMFMDNSGSLLCDVVTAGEKISFKSGLTINAWNHVACVYDGVNVTSYVNGVPGTPVAASGNLTNTGALDISDSNAFLRGALDDIRLYNRALSADEVKQLYQMGR